MEVSEIDIHCCGYHNIKPCRPCCVESDTTSVYGFLNTFQSAVEQDKVTFHLRHQSASLKLPSFKLFA